MGFFIGLTLGGCGTLLSEDPEKMLVLLLPIVARVSKTNFIAVRQALKSRIITTKVFNRNPKNLVRTCEYYDLT